MKPFEKSTFLGSAEVQVGFKIEAKMGPKAVCQIRCMLTLFFIDFGSIFGTHAGTGSQSHNDQNSIPKWVKIDPGSLGPLDLAEWRSWGA